MTAPVQLSTPELATLSGLSYRQLDHWNRVGVFPGRRTTREGQVVRLYDERDLIAARFLIRVSKALGGKVPTTLVDHIVAAARGNVHPCLVVELGGGVSLHVVGSS